MSEQPLIPDVISEPEWDKDTGLVRINGIVVGWAEALGSEVQEVTRFVDKPCIGDYPQCLEDPD